METVLQKKIQEVLDKTGMSLVEIARGTGISKENIYKWYRGTKPSDSYVYNKLIKFLDDVLAYLPAMSIEELKQHYELQKQYGAEFVTQRELSFMIKTSLNHKSAPKPFLTGNVCAGTIIHNGEELELVLNRIDAPCLGPLEGLVEVQGDSMAPTFASGTLIGIKLIEHRNLLDWGGYYYLLDRNHMGFARRLYEGPKDGEITLISDNPDQQRFPACTKHWNDIIAVFRIVAVVKKI